MGRVRCVVAIVAVAALAPFAAAPTAQATLVFVRNAAKPAIWVAADDGSGQRRVALGSNPRISPDGLTIAYMRTSAPFYRPELMVVPADGSAPPRLLMAGWREPSTFAWSPGSGTIAALRGPELGRQRLILIDVASGAQRVVARGFFNGVSFSPDGSQIVYARSARQRWWLHSDVYRAEVAGGAPLRITHNGHSLNPLWSPVRPPVCVRAAPPCVPPERVEQIVFVKLLGLKQRRYFPKNELFLMGPNGEAVRRLTHTRVGPLLQGLTPTDWSADGTHLLAEFGGQDTSYAVTVNPFTGAERTVGGHSPSNWLIGTALSTDGSAILGYTGGFEPGQRTNVVSVPYAGGRATVLTRHAFEPDWSH